MLSCIAAVAIAAMVGKKAYESQVSDSLLLENVEALSNDGEREIRMGYDPVKYMCKTRHGEGVTCGRKIFGGKDPECNSIDC